MGDPPGRRLHRDDEPGVPRLLPAVLQPARPAGPRRSGPVRAGPPDRLSAGPRLGRGRPVLRPAPDASVERLRAGGHEPELHPPGVGGRERARRSPTVGRGGTGRVPASGPSERAGPAGDRPFPARRPPSGLRGVRPELLRRSGGPVGGGDGRDVPHLLPRLLGGVGLRRAAFTLSSGPVGPPGRTSERGRSAIPTEDPGGTDRSVGGCRGGHRALDGARRRPERPVRRGGAGHRTGRAAPPGGRLSRPRRRGVAFPRVGVPFGSSVPGLALLAGSPGPPAPSGLPGHRRTSHPGQRQRAGALRGRVRGVVAAHRWFGGGAARLRAASGLRSRHRAGLTVETGAIGLSGVAFGPDRGRAARAARGLFAVPTGRFRAPVRGHHPRPVAGRGRRPRAGGPPTPCSPGGGGGATRCGACPAAAASPPCARSPAC
ncbi:putative beta-carotene desaturase/methylase [Nocardiopsis alba ATCC BAA-2165]|uniref:Putative beta-carotene desaturase/methylase n=1 Tax=Nocardiopsis alba (strain ATCC BAA-2165 / BE74) TaxID=1205910 RepID=J7LA23_NOCAA|nr:putative beta-carotene desaturase/methylase [Nocardiopsis alba ATCC BAA-2165]